MASHPLECHICCNTYSDDHCPRILPCSHEFCSRCIDGLISTQKKECPTCKQKFTANSAEDVMINRGLLDAAKQLPSKNEESKITSTRPKRPFLDATKYFGESVIGKGIAVCEETEVEVNDRIKSNKKMREGLQGFTQTLEGIIKLSSQGAQNNIARDNKLLMDKLDILKGKGRQMKDSVDQLEAATDFASAASPMDEAEKVLQEVNETADEIKQLLQENKGNIKQDTLKMKINLENALKVIERMTEEEEQQEPEQEQEEGEPEPEEERDSVVKIAVTDLRSPQGRLRGDAQRRVFATMSCEGTLRVAPVKVESNNQVSCTHLQEGVLQPRCFVIELEPLMQWSPSPSPSPSSPPRAFLNLVYKSTPLGRVIIRVTENGLWGLNFLHMCAGGMGPSYAHSHVSSVGNKGKAGENVFMGQYVPHGGGGGGGTSTRAVLSSSEEDWERERKSGIYKETSYKAGEVRGHISYEDTSRFWIVTRDHPSWDGGYCFGMVEEGLDVLRTTILKYPRPDIKRVRVGECGLIL